MSAIQIVNAQKRFKDVQALHGISFEVKKGEFFGLLGPNGAGKTTLIHSIVGLNRLDEGTIYVHGYESRKEFLKTHSLIGFSPQEINLDRFFSIRKILYYQAGFFGIPRSQRWELVDSLLEKFQLTQKSHLPHYRLSGGMQKRLLIAKSLINNPQVLILDEPTAGVDVEQRHHLWKYLRILNKKGTTVILTTHYIDEAEELCDRIGIIHLGKVREMGGPQELINKYCDKRVCLNLSKSLDPHNIKDVGFKTEIREKELVGYGANVGEISQTLHQVIAKDPECRILDVQVDRGNLEEVFLKVTGSRIEEEGE